MKITNYDYFIIYNILLVRTYKLNISEHFAYFASEINDMLNWVNQYGSLKNYGCEGMMEEDYPSLFKQMIEVITDLINNHEIN